MPRNFWPNIQPSKSKMPVSTLQQQAALLGRKTRNVVTATVITSPEGKDFVHELRLVAPALGHYTYEVLTVRHPISLYPARIYDHVRSKEMEAPGQSEFEQMLKEILSSTEMRDILQVLVDQSNAAKPRAVPAPAKVREPFVKEPLPPVADTHRR